MRKNWVMLALTLGLGLAAIPGESVAGEVSETPRATPTAAGPADEPETPLQAALRGLITRVWADASETWAGIYPGLPRDRLIPRINFVPKVSAAHCYGLYISAGPVYCSGNGTVFIGLEEAERLSGRFEGLGEPVLEVLVAHEFGHHLQMLAGRFVTLSRMMREAPERRRELAMRFELEADCLAGVWAGTSHGLGASQNARAEFLSSLTMIGDDRVQIAALGAPDPSNFWHGTSEQRARWFVIGLEAHRADACDALTAKSF